METPRKYLIVIAGPTAVGKTALAIQTAQHFNTEIISADSRQFYQELNIGVAKPSTKELATVPHHFIGHISIQQDYTAADYEKEALERLETLFKKHNVVIATGGSGLFISALLEGLDPLPKSGSIRETLNIRLQDEGLPTLANELKQLDIEEYNAIDTDNQRRVIRSLEVCLVSGRKASELKQQQKASRPFTAIKIVLNRDRQELYTRINERVDIMLNEGLIEEAKQLISFKHLNALKTVGYKELFEHFEGSISQERAIELIKQHTRNYAKRQLTWFRKDEEYQWLSPTAVNEIIKYCTESMKQ